MVLRDLDGGDIAAVCYDSNAPVEKTLQCFAVNLSANPTFGQILNQARGEKVEVVLQQANATQPGTMTGTIMGVEQKQEAVDKALVNVDSEHLVRRRHVPSSCRSCSASFPQPDHGQRSAQGVGYADLVA